MYAEILQAPSARVERPLRIAQVCPYDMDRPGGVQGHIRDTAEALRELGHEVSIISPDMGRRPPPAGEVEAHRIGKAARIKFGGTAFEVALATGDELRRLRALMRDGGFDVAHYHGLWTPVLPMQALLASTAPSVATFHETPPDTPAGALARRVFPQASRMLLRRLDRVTAVSTAPSRHLRPAPGQTIQLIPPCTNLRRFSDAPAPLRRPDAPVRILFLGRLEPRKGCKVLVEAYRLLRAEGLSAELTIVGAGAEEAALRALVAQHRLPGVTFAGAVGDDALPRVYGDCDIFCAPSPFGESFGIVIAEAMAAGRPVAAAANPGYSTLLRGEAARFLSKPGDAASLHLALRELVMDPALRRRLGEWGRVEALQYDCRTVAPQLVATYRDAILAHAAARRPRLRLFGQALDAPIHRGADQGLELG